MIRDLSVSKMFNIINFYAIILSWLTYRVPVPNFRNHKTHTAHALGLVRLRVQQFHDLKKTTPGLSWMQGPPVAQLVRASSRCVEGRGFKSLWRSNIFSKSKSLNLSCASAELQKSQNRYKCNRNEATFNCLVCFMFYCQNQLRA